MSEFFPPSHATAGQTRQTLRPLFPNGKRNFAVLYNHGPTVGSPPPPTPSILVIPQFLTLLGGNPSASPPPIAAPPPTDPVAWRPRLHLGLTLPTVSGSVDPQQAVSGRTVDALPGSANSCSAALQRVVPVDCLTVPIRQATLYLKRESNI